ncbi:hypothetical protein A2W24_03735 [Microgenomates group bacterium RBG_16_45_19]|nr:MAG: hypothetical protein A2W24_03735 [Microgenomates group bacterium RBG_16_45_19]
MDLTKMSLNIEFAGKTFKNPVIAASGIVTNNLYSTKKCIEAGVGGVIIKSVVYYNDHISPPRPQVWLLDRYGYQCGSTNIAAGFLSPEKGVKLLQELRPLAEKESTVLIGNINLTGVFREEETRDLGRRLQEAGAEMIEVSTSCPIMVALEFAGDWSKVTDIKFLTKIITTLKEEVSIPVFLKLPAHVGIDYADAIEQAGADAHSILSIVPGTVIDIETGRPLVPLPHYLGHALRHHANYQTSRLALKAKRPIMSGGGITTGRDVIERLMCGATLAAVHTAIMRYGYQRFTVMINSLKSFVDKKGYGAVKDIVGISVPYIENFDEYKKFVEQKILPREAMTITIDNDRCVRCGSSLCENCWNGAISKKQGFPEVDLERCEFCGICQSICPAGAISIRPKTELSACTR